MLIVCGGDNRIDSKGKEDSIMAEAVGLESESVETEGPDTDGPGGPDTQQEGNNTGNN
jgi:hypothetical protein